MLDRKTLDISRRSEDMYEEDQEFWSRILSGIRGERIEKLPSVTQYGHSSLVDLCPVKPNGDVEAAFEAKPRDAAQDDLMYKLLDKLMRPLLRLVLPVLDYISMPDLTQDYDDDFPADIKAELNASHQRVRFFAIYTLLYILT